MTTEARLSSYAVIADELLDIARAVTYKNWAIHFEWVGDSDVLLYGRYPGVTDLYMAFTYQVADTYTGAPILITGGKDIHLDCLSDLGTDELRTRMLTQIWDAIMEAETHEAMEHFMIGGKQVYDPHPGGTVSLVSPRLHDPNLAGWLQRDTAAPSNP